MKKMSKKQKEKNRKKQKKAYRKRKKQQLSESSTKPRPWEPVKMEMFNFSNPIPPDMSAKKRLALIRSIGANAKKDFEKKYPKLSKWFEEYDPLYILSFCYLYFCSHPEGTDPEATGEVKFHPFFLEILQAFSLINKRTFGAKPLLGEAEKLYEEMREIGDLINIRHLDMPTSLSSEEDINAYRLRMEMMSHTTAVRNWAYVHQIKRATDDLATLIDSDFKDIYGVSAVALMKIFFDLCDERNDLLNEHISKVRGFYKHRKADYKVMMQAYDDVFPENVEEDSVDEIWELAGKNKENLFGMLICHSDLKLSNIFSFSFEHIESILPETEDKKSFRDMLDKLSYQFGDLKAQNKEHIILDNPVSHKPFIKVNNDSYFSAIWGSLHHYALDILEDLVWENDSLRKKYTKLKAKYLEDQTEELFRTYFPNAEIKRGSLWKDPETGKDYENDLIVLIDSFAIVVEEKSGGISDPAKRGAPDRLFETLKRLMEEPSEQALRFVKFLKNNKKEHTFSTRRGVSNAINSENIKYYIPLGITFSHLGMIGSNLKKLIEAKIVDKSLEELAPSMSFTDLEIVLSLLDSEAERIHYLARRREIEAHLQYEGDELDLFGFYLDNGFNIGEDEYTKEYMLNISLKSKELDPYIIGTSEGLSLKKPALAMTKWWRDLLNKLAEKKISGWIETSFILLNSTKEDQKKFERKFVQLRKKVIKGSTSKPHNWVVFASGPERRRYIIIGYPYTMEDRGTRNDVMAQAIDDENFEQARGAVVIGVNVKYDHYPYSVFARKLATNLFDTLTV